MLITGYLALSSCTSLPVLAQNTDATESRLTYKVKAIEEKMQVWKTSGRDTASIVDQLKLFNQKMEAGQIASAEQILDALLEKLNKTGAQNVSKSTVQVPIPFSDETQYLIFMPPNDAKIYEATNSYDGIDQWARKIKEQIGSSGSSKRKLGFAILIPLWLLDKAAPDKMQQVIRDAFRVGRDRQMAVFFSIDSHCAWDNRQELWNYFDPKLPGYNPQNKSNVEWSDWQGTPYRHRYLDWGAPQSLAPPICVNAPKIRSEIARMVSRDIMPALDEGLKQLGAAQQNLFAGITVTAEPSIDNYSMVDAVNPQLANYMKAQGAPKLRLGFNALTNAGYSQKNPPRDYETALAKVNQDFGAYWAEQFVRAGISPERLYTHVAAASGVPGTPACAFTNAPISSAFNRYCRPGWTTYAAGPLANGFAPIYSELRKHKNPHWAASEASPTVFGGPSFSAYEYLRWHYAHGASVVVMNTGATSKEATQALERGVFGPDSISAYRRFLSQ